MVRLQKNIHDLKCWQLARFSVVGLVATLCYSVIAWELTIRTTLSPTAASAIAYSVSGVFSFFGHRVFSFRSRNNMSYELPRFLILLIIGYAISILLPYVFTVKNDMHPMIAIILVCLVIPVFNYLYMIIYVFNKG